MGHLLFLLSFFGLLLDFDLCQNERLLFAFDVDSVPILIVLPVAGHRSDAIDEPLKLRVRTHICFDIFDQVVSAASIRGHNSSSEQLTTLFKMLFKDPKFILQVEIISSDDSHFFADLKV